MRFHVDQCDPSGVAGWVDRDGPVQSLVISLNGERLCDLSATSFRPDLCASGLGDGKRAFSFPLNGYLSDGLNVITLSVDGEEIFRQTLIFYRGSDGGGPVKFGENQQLLEYSQTRWKGDEPPEGLTWGRIMDAQSLWQIYRGGRRFVGTENILEVGVGYGRLLDTALKLNVAFGSYRGIDLSAARVAGLRTRFPQRNIQFHVGDVNAWRGSTVFDVVLASVVFDFLYPDCCKALQNLRAQVSPGAHVFIDFICATASAAHFEPNGTYIRAYSEEDLRTMFADCGYTVHNIQACILGEGAAGPVKRNVVVAQASVPRKP